MNERQQVVVVGGGFGGVNVTKALAHADVDVTLVDRTNHHLFQPLLYQVAAGILSEGVIAPALRGVIKKQANARTVLAEVTHFDLDARVVYGTSPDGRALQRRYDSLVVAGGATHAYFGHDEWAEFAPGMKTLEDARRLRSHILSAFEMAETIPDPEQRKMFLTFVVVGAGPTGGGTGRAGGRAGQGRAAAGVPVGGHRPRGTRGAGRGRAGGARAVRPEVAALHPPPPGEDGRRSPGGHRGDGDGPRQHHRQERRG